jgi:hypothetical protein
MGNVHTLSGSRERIYPAVDPKSSSPGRIVPINTQDVSDDTVRNIMNRFK